MKYLIHNVDGRFSYVDTIDAAAAFALGRFRADLDAPSAAVLQLARDYGWSLYPGDVRPGDANKEPLDLQCAPAATIHGRHVGEVERLLSIALQEWARAATLRGEDATIAARSAAWRLADAAVLMRLTLEALEIGGAGVTEPTGRGALLPSPVGEV